MVSGWRLMILLLLGMATACATPVRTVEDARWRGFNLGNMFWKGWKDGPFSEDDFRWIHELGFNFVRLPLDYRIWTDEKTQKVIDEAALARIDRAISFGHKYGLHVCVNLHHAPGYTSGDEPDGRNLWRDPETETAFVSEWEMFARRYHGISARELSFNLLNEPAKVDEATYARIIRRTALAIWAIDPNRPVIADGLEWAKVPVPALAKLPIIQANRGYDPGKMPKSWPGVDAESSLHLDRDWLLRQTVLPWRVVTDEGVKVIVGEFGTHANVSHAVTLAWMEDNLKNWRAEGWGWALWNFSGEMGVLDSGRSDVTYENFHGHKLDRAMLELLRRY